jgi:adenylate kinase
MSAMRVLLLAPPGAGKGTQAARLASRFGLTTISSGDLLRAHTAAGTPIGRLVASSLASGDLVLDELVLAVLAVPVVSAALEGGYVLDGFPRTVAQAEVAQRLLGPLGLGFEAAITLDVDPAELARRLAARQEGRSDDGAAVVRHRMDVYDQLTAPLLDHYAAQGILHHIDGEGTPDEVAARIEAALAPLIEAEAGRARAGG